MSEEAEIGHCSDAQVVNEKEDTQHAVRDDRPDAYPKGLQLKLLTLSLMFAVFIMALDTTILCMLEYALPVPWYTSAYLLPLMSLQPTMGKLYSFLPVKPLFIAAMIIFEAGSVLCASAPSSNIFIMGRVISGVGAAGIYAGGMIVITTAVPIERISIYLATLSSMWALAALIGPPLGGAFTDSHRLTWRFCFWIDLRKGADIWRVSLR
jgi:MFS family permease